LDIKTISAISNTYHPSDSKIKKRGRVYSDITPYHMMITPLNILRHELIGLRVKIVDATHEGYICEGTVVGETRNIIKIRMEKGIKTIPKNSATFEFTLPSKARVKIDGKLLISRPEDRIKKKYRIKFV